MANNDIASMSDDELMTEWTALGDQVESARERLKEFSRVYQERCEAERLQRVLGDMTPEQREAAHRAIDAMPAGVESEEAMPTDDEEVQV